MEKAVVERGHARPPDLLQEALVAALDGLSPRRALDCSVVEVPANLLLRTTAVLRDAPELLFQQLTDITAVDYPEREARYELVYHLLSMHHNYRVRLKVSVPEGEAVPSSVRLFPVADWLEREIWDMFGVPFSDHPDLRRILTDYGFEGHPLRKDFPLTGHVEVRYDEARREVVYEPVNLQQAYRSFDFESPWEEVGRLFQREADGKPPADGGEEGA